MVSAHGRFHDAGAPTAPQTAALADTARAERADAFEDAVRATQVLFRQAERDGYRHRVLAFFEGWGQLASAIDFVQGRKQVILFSAGFDESLLVGNQSTEATQDSEAVIRGRIWEVPSDSRFGDAGLRRQMDERLRAFARSDAVVHTVDLGGLTARGDARQAGPEANLRHGQESLSPIAIAPQARPRMLRDRPDRVCLLAFVGGRAADPGASFEITPQLLDGHGASVPLGRVHVERTVAEGEFRWCVLGFTPEAASPGEYTLRVRLRDPASGRVSEVFRTVTVG